MKTILNNTEPIKRFYFRTRVNEYAAQYRQFYSYFPNAGFGNMFSEWAQKYMARNNRSYGNGAAMRVAPIAYAYNTLEQVLIQAKASCISTHNHSEAIIGAQAVASAVFLARTGQGKEEIKKHLEKKYYNLSEPLNSIKDKHVFDSRSSYSVPPAIIAFIESSDYESAVRNAVSLGGDADTQACIAGAIAEAFYRKIPDHIKQFCNSKLDFTIKNVLREFYDKYKINIT